MVRSCCRPLYALYTCGPWGLPHLTCMPPGCMQVRRHLKGERNIPHLSDQVQVWKQEYKVLLRKTQQLMQQSEDIMIAAQT